VLYGHRVAAPLRSRAVVALVLAAAAAYVAARVRGWPGGTVVAPEAFDFHPLIWAPVRGLLDGYNIYADHGAYVSAFHPRVAATAHPPFVLLLFSVFAVPPLHAAWLAFVVVNLSCVLAALWLLVDPQSPREELVVALAGAVLVAGGFAEHLFELGQLTGVATLGLALMVRNRTGWRGVLGVLLLATVPQSGVPLSILLIRGRARVVAIGWALALLLSVPPVILLINATHSVGTAAHSLVSVLSRPTAHAPDRIDVVGLVVGHSLWLSLALVVVAAVCVVARRWTVGPTDLPRLLLAVTVTLLLWYHQPYDLVMLGVVAAALAVRTRDTAASAFAVLYGVTALLVSGALIDSTASVFGTTPIASWHVVSRGLPLLALALCVGWAVRRRAVRRETTSVAS
jgi:hypothetical protein